jgi:UDP-3-O-[3-hydroxymyristoyl] glucosamine N-acyltransferase
VDDSAVIGTNVYIGPECKIGKNSVIHANSSLAMNVEIGKNTIIHFNSILGSDGFGYAPQKDGYIKIEQLGKLIIGDNVEIGAGCTIDRGAIDNTEIHNGVKLDNQVHIAHNVILGEHSAIAASCAIAGSTTVGKNLQMGGLSGILGHLNIADNVSIGAHTLITKSIDKPGNYVGIMPAQEQKDWAKSSVFIKQRKSK